MELAPSTNYLKYVILGFSLGVFISSVFTIIPLYAVLTIFVGGAVLLGEKISEGRVTGSVLVVGVVIISLGLGSLRYSVKDYYQSVEPIHVGVVVGEPESRESYTRFVFEAESGVRALVYTELYSEVEYGDRVRLQGEFEEPENFDNFNYRAYLAKDDILYTINSKEVEILESGVGSPIKSALFKTKNSFISRAEGLFSEPESSLLMGLIVAGKDSLPKSVLEEFQNAGVVHIVVLSGFNIMIIAEFLRRVFTWIFIRARFTRYPQGPAVFSILGIALFVLMTGAESTIVRAGIMALVAIGAKFVGRGYSVSRALILAAFIMIIINPKILIFDPSFQLSFLATLGMIYVVPRVDRFLASRLALAKWDKFREIVSQTLGTQLAVLPLLIATVGSFSAMFLPANVLILPLVPWAMLLGFVSTILAYVHEWLAYPFALITHLILKWILAVAHLLGGF